MLRFAGVVPETPLAVALTLYVPDAVGVPLSTRVELPDAKADNPGAFVVALVIDVVLLAVLV